MVPDSFDESQPGKIMSDEGPSKRLTTIARPKDRHAARIEKRLPDKGPPAVGEPGRSNTVRDARLAVKGF
jgi:hypothetical protein